MQKRRLDRARDARYSHDRLREARLAAGYTQAEVAELCGCELDLVRRWERGSLSPKAEWLLKLMVIYDIDVSCLLTGL